MRRVEEDERLQQGQVWKKAGGYQRMKTVEDGVQVEVGEEMSVRNRSVVS
jgi:hypothetical protein